MSHRKKLIEVALPLEAINKASAREKSIRHADNLQGRLQKRLEELKPEGQISPLPPVVLGGLLVVPLDLITAMSASTTLSPSDSRRHAGQCRAGACRRHGDRVATSVSTRPTASSRSSATTSRAASPAPVSYVSSR